MNNRGIFLGGVGGATKTAGLSGETAQQAVAGILPTDTWLQYATTANALRVLGHN